ncbi:hypothetical protein AAGW04_16045 [Pectobacterium aroidearum]|uniref:hypothetical protein n=1 Tax=Pectobacterium aroidearum TaxID=1201031 RepID=UPI0031580FCD
MSKKNSPAGKKCYIPKWLTIKEAVSFAKQNFKVTITDTNIYRHALCGDIYLSIYFQSPITVKKIKKRNNKLKLTLNKTLVTPFNWENRTFLFSSGIYAVSTEGSYICPKQKIIDTPLLGYEHIIIQTLLAQSLKITPPKYYTYPQNLGLSVMIHGELFQLFERKISNGDLNNSIALLPNNLYHHFVTGNLRSQNNKEHIINYSPSTELPPDACFVIRNTQFEKLINLTHVNTMPINTPPRITTPLSRLFWLACKNNKEISSLITHPYKLLSIFEQWASADGITDRLSGDTLKSALERGSPTSPTLTK